MCSTHGRLRRPCCQNVLLTMRLLSFFPPPVPREGAPGGTQGALRSGGGAKGLPDPAQPGEGLGRPALRGPPLGPDPKAGGAESGTSSLTLGRSWHYSSKAHFPVG